MADILELLIAERNKIDLAIAALQGHKRRGRPPGSGQKQAAKAPAKKRGRPKMSAAQRKAASARMKAYWAQRRKGTKKVA
jgi:hypothetical protein